MKYLTRILGACAFLPGLALATTILPTDESHVHSLNGQWHFKLEQDGDRPEHGKINGPISAPKFPAHFEPFEKPDYTEDAKWSPITVPGNWEMFGFSPATFNQPDNAIGLYRLQFDVPADWKGRIVKINFEGIQNAAEVYLNGQPVNVDEPSEHRANYHQGGDDAFQADLTPAIHFGEKNTLAIRVYKNVKGADLDSGDFFFLGGIYRPVTLFSVPQTHIEDVKVETRLLPDDKAELKVIITKSGSDTTTASIQLHDASKAGGLQSPGLESANHQSITNNPRSTVITEILDHPKLWSAEKPNLYTLNIDLKDSAGNVVEHLTRHVGVREITLKDGIFLINNVPIKFTGMCRHEVWPTLGTALDEDAWRKDITLMKAANINAIRTSHYPYGSKFYDLCDELGMYVMDEMAAGWCDTTDASLSPFFAQHARELVRRDKNHACVVVWAVGNENKEGDNNKVAADEIHKLDTTRPRLVSWRKGDQYGVELDDLHYTPPSRIAELNAMTERRKTYPMIFLENPNMWDVSNGADYGCLDLWVHVIDRTWQEVWKDDHVPGSFMWEWQDRAIVDDNPKKLYAFDPTTGVNYVKVKGLCDAFRTPRAAYYNVKMAYTPIKVDLKPTIDGSTISVNITNRFSFTDLSELTTTWHLLAGGKELQSADLHPQLAPRSTGSIKLDLPADTVTKADTLRLDFTHPDGRNLATYDLHLKDEPDTTPRLDTAHLAGVNFPKFNLVAVTQGTHPWGWRDAIRHPAKLVNIKIEQGGSSSSLLDEAALAATPLADVSSMNADIVFTDDTKAEIAGHVHAGFADGKLSWELNWSRENPKAARRNVGATDVQELGWRFAMPAADDHFSWHRQGYWSYYPPTHVGRIAGTALPDSADAHLTKLTRPDAFDFNSTKYNCDWATLADASGHGIAVAFSPDTRQHCRANTAPDGSHELIVNAHCAPPRDLSSNVVPELYFTLAHGATAHGSFRLGACGE